MKYVDGFLLPVPKKNLAAYKHRSEGLEDLEGTRGA